MRGLGKAAATAALAKRSLHTLCVSQRRPFAVTTLFRVPETISSTPSVSDSVPFSTVDIPHNTDMTKLSAFENILNLPQVRVKNRSVVEAKLRDMVGDGSDKFMVITDFDYTLSRAKDADGSRCWTTHGVFDNEADRVSANLSQKFKDLKAKFYPIEFDPNMSNEEKTPYMEEWWNTSHGYIIEAKFTKGLINEFVKDSKIKLRDGSTSMMSELKSKNVPFVVFSAGLGNIIEMFFDQRLGEVPSNVHIISNMMQFNDKEEVVSFSEPLIHTFCKNASVIKKEAGFFHEISPRTNVMLLGDSLGDLHMDVGVERDGHTLKIGFLNFQVDALLDTYLDGYDIVLIDDQSMTVPNLIQQAITAARQ